MSDIEQEALALVNEVAIEECEEVNLAPHKTLCAALRLSVIEHEDTKQELSDYKQKVSDVVEDVVHTLKGRDVYNLTRPLSQFIIPAPKPDPLVGVMKYLDWSDKYADPIRAALDDLGFEIREKNDD